MRVSSLYQFVLLEFEFKHLPVMFKSIPPIYYSQEFHNFSNEGDYLCEMQTPVNANRFYVGRLYTITSHGEYTMN